MDYREQIVLQSALNAMPRSVSITAYRFRHVADRLAKRGLLELVDSTLDTASYAITLAGQGKLNSLHVQHLSPPPADSGMDIPVAAE